MPLSGNCYCCGVTLGKTAMKNHLLKEHAVDGEACYLIKVEGKYNKDYWLLIDIAIDKSLSAVDKFLRNIWLECCGHMSGFSIGWDAVGKTRKLSELAVGDKLLHEYDYGTTTETILTVMAKTTRPAQLSAVRLLARNIPPEHPCASCGKSADNICVECSWEEANPFICEDCLENHPHDMLLPVTNSPRMGECGYTGEYDTFTFDPKKFNSVK